MARRRDVIIGAGALAFGSGAMSVNAAFNNSVDASGDFRAVAAEDLVVQPGEAFRDATGAYDSSLDGSSGYNYSGTNNDFFAVDSPSTGGDDGLGADIGTGDLPAIFVSDNENSNLVVKVAVKVGTTAYFDAPLQVVNNGDTSKSVGIKFAAFGVDTDGDQDGNGGAVAEENVVGGFTFYDADTSSQISTKLSHFESNTISSPGDQRVDNTVTVDPGETEQVDLEVDLTSSVQGANASNPIDTQIRTASNASGNPFTGDVDAVQLVDQVRFGEGPTSTA